MLSLDVWPRVNPLFFFPAVLVIVTTPVFAGYQYYLKVTNDDRYVNQFKCNYTGWFLSSLYISFFSFRFVVLYLFLLLS